MPFINHSEREIVCKIVYAGPAYSGKTTSLEWIAGQAGKSDGRKVVSVATEGERTLFFDFFALDLGRVGGYTVRLQLFTVPGQPKYEAARRIVLRGADAVIFVADSQRARMMDNVQALTALEQALLDEGFAPGEAPLVLLLEDLGDTDLCSLTRQAAFPWPAVAAALEQVGARHRDVVRGHTAQREEVARRIH